MKTREEYINDAYAMLNRSQSISDYMDIPSNLKQLDITSKSHPKFANYDHSLEMDRLSTLREKYDCLEPEHTQVQDYKNINPSEVPDLSGIFDNIYGEK